MVGMLVLFLLLSFPCRAAETDLCEILNLKNCSGVTKLVRRSSAQSLPSSTTAAQFNPANVSHDRGWGTEVMYQPGNPPSLSFVSGTGKVGAALVSSKIENGFFGNRVIELEPDYLERRDENTQYLSDKYTLSAGASLWKNKWFGLDLGLMGKYHPEIKQVNPGIGLSGRLWNLTFGASTYRDDVFLKFEDKVDPRSETDYATLYGDETYKERFNVQNYFMGLRFKKVFFDAGIIRTRYRFYGENNGDSMIHLYSFAGIWRKFLFNIAYRHERSPLWRYDGKDLVDERRKNETYYGVQYSFNQHFITGLHYNYYLLREFAVSGTLFF
jgi:hypothetical protein